MLSRVEPPGYRRQAKREQPVLGPHLAWIHEVLEQDKQEPCKQRHTAKRIFDRLRAERGYAGGYTVVNDAVQKWKATTKEVYIPLSHPPGEAQVDFGFAYVDVAGERQQVALFVTSLPYSDALYIQAFPRECTEAFLEGHNRAFRFIGASPPGPESCSGIGPPSPLKWRFSRVGAESLRVRRPCGVVVTRRPAAVRGCGCRSRAARLSVPERRRDRHGPGRARPSRWAARGRARSPAVRAVRQRAAV